MEIPTEGGALFERADQDFLNLPLGDGKYTRTLLVFKAKGSVVPIIVVFTKFDLLVSKIEMNLEPDVDMDENQFNSAVMKRASLDLNMLCFQHLRKATLQRPVQLPCMRVSICGTCRFVSWPASV